MWIDTHAHLYLEVFDQDRKEMLDHAKDVGVEKIILPNIDLDSIDPLVALSNDYPNDIFPSMGLHPCSVQENYLEVLEEIYSRMSGLDLIAIGEIGLDLYWDQSTKDIQIEALKEQMKWAEEMDLPVIIHARESLNELIDLFDTYKRKFKGVFHCFTGTPDQAHKIVDMGFYLGIGGVVTFKNGGIREILESLPMDRIVLETDAPYLAPTPYRGKRNESSYVPIIGKVIADQLGISLEEVARITSDNAKRLFSL